MKQLALLILLLGALEVNGQQKKIDSLKKIITLEKEDTNKVNDLNDLSWKLLNIPNIDQALEYATKGKKLAEQLNYKKGISSSLNTIAGVYRKTGDYVKAEEYYTQQLKIREEIGDKNGVAASLVGIGTCHHLQGNYHLALEYYLKSLKLMEEINNNQGVA
ncbi:MAG TPA: tetratricopeptide repeat protein, partial [Nitrosopumilaceae archaeon]|nr:tetratricopeptide repeat protein [Nitrosopumilaceae archaeon]